jgi:hypothetical protein
VSTRDIENLLRRWLAAQGDLAAELHVLAEATRYDAAHPDEPSLRDELCAAIAGDPVGVA